MFLLNYLSRFQLVIIVLIITGTAHSADYPPNIDYGSQGDFVTKRGTEYGRTADLTLVGPLLVTYLKAQAVAQTALPGFLRQQFGTYRI